LEKEFMKISRFIPWCVDNILYIFGISAFVFIIAGFILAMVYISPISEFPLGSDVVVKGTDIHGTVVGIHGTDMNISTVSKDGTVKTVKYNYNLLIRQH
jgi:hypothetical protein